MIASSGVQADKADSVKDRYNRAADGVRALHAIWNRHAAAPARRSPTRWRPVPTARFDQLRRGSRPRPTAGFRPRTSSAVSNTSCAKPRARRRPRSPFAHGDRGTLGRLSADSQREADELLGNQIPETILMAKLARELGAFALEQLWRRLRRQRVGARSRRGRRGFGERVERAPTRGACPSPAPVPWFVGATRARRDRNFVWDGLLRCAPNAYSGCGSRHSPLFLHVVCSAPRRRRPCRRFDTTESA